jgi:hypothetical protein
VIICKHQLEVRSDSDKKETKASSLDKSLIADKSTKDKEQEDGHHLESL